MALVSRCASTAPRIAQYVAQKQSPVLLRQAFFRQVQWPSKPHTMRQLLQRRMQSTVHAPPPQPQRSLPVRFLRSSLWIVFMSLCTAFGGFVVAPYFIPKPTFDAFYAYLTQKPLSAADTIAAYDDELAALPGADAGDVRTVNALLVASSLAQSLRAEADGTAWREARPSMKIPAALRPTNLTAGTLAGPGRLTVPPLIFTSRDPSTGKQDGRALVALLHLGPQLCGHPGIVHGGLLATLLDEGLARCCFPALPNRMGVTANLTVDYRRPAMAALPAGPGSAGVEGRGGFFVLRAETVKVEGRKAWVRGWIEELPVASQDPAADGEAKEGSKKKIVVEAQALFVEPRGAKHMRRLYADDE